MFHVESICVRSSWCCEFLVGGMRIKVCVFVHRPIDMALRMLWTFTVDEVVLKCG